MYRIGIDVGGTFTDFAAVDHTGAVFIAKWPSTPEDQSTGVVQGLAALAEAIGISRDQLLARTAVVVHGTTVATNALLERKGARVGLLTTAGHRDVIEQREGLKPERYNLRLPPAPVLVPRARRRPVSERMRFDGTVETPLDRDTVAAAIATLKHRNVEAVAVCYLHSYRNPAHENETAAMLADMMPDAYVSLSSRVLPQIKEYERFTATVVNAFVGPALAGYLGNLEGRLREAGYGGNILIMQSHGGLASITESIRLAAACVLSGPAGGIAGAKYAVKITGEVDLVSFDMGGTSTDIALIQQGEAALSSDRSVDDIRVALPSLDIHTLGAGGGSIARIDAGGLLRVGPDSAGAVPGPACYGRGGTEATVTDANVVLGYYEPARFLGGRTAFDAAAAERAVAAIAQELGTSVAEAAEGIQRVVDTQMAEGIRLVSVRQGVDPRASALLSFGGAAGLHITGVARILEITKVVVPRVASVMSAWGMLATDLRHEFVRTLVGEIRGIGAGPIGAAFAEMEREGRTAIDASLVRGVSVQRSLDLRYGEQIYEISVNIDHIDLAAPDAIDNIVGRFHRLHQDLYTYSSPNQDVVLVNLRLTAIGQLDSMPTEPEPPTERRQSVVGRRRILVDGWREVSVHDMDRLASGETIEGPAIIESTTTTLLLRPGDRAVVTKAGWLKIDVS